MFTRKCKICQKQFDTEDPTQYICPEGHVSKCVICGKDVDIHKSGRPKKYCSTACRVQGRKLDALDHGYKRICDICGKEFYTLQKRQTTCDDTHYFPCPICGKPVEYRDGNKDRCCCREHTILKRKQTNQRIYGGNSPASSKAVVEKMKSTNLKRYGVEWKAQTDEFQQKREATCLDKYGVPISSQADSVKQKAEQTCMEHYGVKHAAQSEEVKRKTKEGFVRKYGVDNPMKLQQSKDKIKETSLEKYGVDHPWKNKEVQEKRKQTWMDKYGVDNPSKCDTVKQKYRDTCLQRYGVDNTSNVPEIKEKIKLSQFAHYGTWYLDSEENRSNRIRPVSKRNLKFSDKLTANNVEHEMEFCFPDAKRRKFDFYLTGTNTLIELDSTPVHNSYKHLNNVPYTHEIQDIQLNKSTLAEDHGFHCVHLFDWDDQDRYVHSLSAKHVPYNMLRIDEVDIDKAIEFVEANDIQMLPPVGKNGKAYGYFDINNNLIACLAVYSSGTVCRYCDSLNYVVDEGVDRLFERFNLTCDVVCDNSKRFIDSNKFERTELSEPRRMWSKGSDFMMDCEKTDYESMLRDGYLPVHDCGVCTYKYVG